MTAVDYTHGGRAQAEAWAAGIMQNAAQVQATVESVREMYAEAMHLLYVIRRREVARRSARRIVWRSLPWYRRWMVARP